MALLNFLWAHSIPHLLYNLELWKGEGAWATG